MASASIARARPLLGTFVEIAADGLPRPALEAAIEAAFAAVERVHRVMSFHDPASDVSRLNHAAARRPVAVDPWTFQVLDAALDLHRRSNGAFDIAVAPALQALGLLPDRGVRTCARRPLRSDEIELLAGARVRFRHPAIAIDLGGIAKGFAVDRAVAALRAHGAASGLVNAGGDLRAFGPVARTVHIRDPRDPRRSLGAIALRDAALASTGARFDPTATLRVMPPAVIDPRTRAPTRALAGATARAPSAMMADALTKVVMICAEAAGALLDRAGADALMVQHDGTILVTPTWQADRAA